MTNGDSGCNGRWKKSGCRSRSLLLIRTHGAFGVGYVEGFGPERGVGDQFLPRRMKRPIELQDSVKHLLGLLDAKRVVAVVDTVARTVGN